MLIVWRQAVRVNIYDVLDRKRKPELNRDAKATEKFEDVGKLSLYSERQKRGFFR
jgi:hypothetical protein